ncbi:MAG: 6-phosphofructokinase [Candidatus Neomarinimicrobiota bacterium]
MVNIKTIGILTSGGDSPGMNAAIRAVVRTSIYYGREIYGIRNGFRGLLEDNIEIMNSQSVSNIIHTGGTILKTARCDEFKTEEGRKKAYDNLKKHGIDALVVIGGDGSFAGAELFCNEFQVPVVGIPATIDNDIRGTDYTIGYDTALNTVVQAVDKIRDTASAHNRLFFIEVMGRQSGFLALNGGLATGAEAILVPEIEDDYDKLMEYLGDETLKHKKSSMVLVAEGDQAGGAFSISQKVKEKFPHYSVRVTILGHLQRGGSPSAIDRINAGRLGVSAVEALLAGERDIMVGIRNSKIIYNSFALSKHDLRKLDSKMLDMINMLAV